MFPVLPSDISVSILGAFLSLKDLVQMDNAMCCKNRGNFLDLLQCVQFKSKFVLLSEESGHWLAMRQMNVLHLELRGIYTLDMVNPSQLQLLRKLSLKISISQGTIVVGGVLAVVVVSCPRLQTFELQHSGTQEECTHLRTDSSITGLVDLCTELKHMHICYVHFPAVMWKELYDRKISFLCFTESYDYLREILSMAGPLPSASMHTSYLGLYKYNCIWNNMSIAEVNLQVSAFVPQVKLGAVRYDDLCRGANISMFQSTFSSLEWIEIQNCTDMDERTFTVILQQPFVHHIDLRNNDTVCSMLPGTAKLGNCISTVELRSFTAITSETLELMNQMLPPCSRIIFRDMHQIPFDLLEDEEDWY